MTESAQLTGVVPPLVTPLTPEYDVVGLSRQEMVFDKEKLLEIYDVTIDRKPM